MFFPLEIYSVGLLTWMIKKLLETTLIGWKPVISSQVIKPILVAVELSVIPLSLIINPGFVFLIRQSPTTKVDAKKQLQQFLLF